MGVISMCVFSMVLPCIAAAVHMYVCPIDIYAPDLRGERFVLGMQSNDEGPYCIYDPAYPACCYFSL